MPELHKMLYSLYRQADQTLMYVNHERPISFPE